MLGWLLVERVRDGKATTLGAASGAVAGLVAITPACAYVSPIGSIILGVVAGALCCSCTPIKYTLGFDDSLDVVAVHLIGGITGALSIGFLGNSVYGGADGVFYGGGWHQLKIQALTVLAVVAYSFVVSFVLGKAINLFMTSRMSDEEQEEGMDLTQHGEAAYEFDSISSGSISGSRPSSVNLSTPSEVQA
jgi:Amt family ammonium transporter